MATNCIYKYVPIQFSSVTEGFPDKRINPYNYDINQIFSYRYLLKTNYNYTIDNLLSSTSLCQIILSFVTPQDKTEYIWNLLKLGYLY